MFFWHDRRESPSGSLERCFTDSLTGVSEAPFSAFNLGLHVGEQHVIARQREDMGDAVAHLACPDHAHRADVHARFPHVAAQREWPGGRRGARAAGNARHFAQTATLAFRKAAVRQDGAG